MEERRTDLITPGASTAAVPGIIARMASGAGDYAQTFTARTRTDVLDLLDGIHNLSAELVSKTLAGNDLARRLRDRGHQVETVFPHHSLYSVLACDEEGAVLSEEMIDVIFRRNLTDRGDSQVHRDRYAAVLAISGLKDDLRWIDARNGGLLARLAAADGPDKAPSVLKDLLSSALSSDPGTTTVDLGGCYINPMIELMDAVEAGTTGAALYPLVRNVVAMEESLASRARDVDNGSAAINPVRVIGSLRELENLASDSIVCSPWAPSSVYQNDRDGRWYEPGSEETLPAGAVWEMMTGSDSGIVMDEDRRVWVLYDAGSPVPKPGPASDHGYLTMANAGRAERFITHPTLSEARSVIEALCSQPGGAPAHLAIRYRAGGDSVFRGITPVSPGTTPGQLPWKQAKA